MGIDGTYNIYVNSPRGEIKEKFIIKTIGKKLEGSYYSGMPGQDPPGQIISFENVKVDGNTVEWTIHVKGGGNPPEAAEHHSGTRPEGSLPSGGGPVSGRPAPPVAGGPHDPSASKQVESVFKVTFEVNKVTGKLLVGGSFWDIKGEKVA